MKSSVRVSERRTSAEIVFESLYDQIMSLGLLPGVKMSEADVAQQFGVSRQPVRDAFFRLESLNLLLIQPQRATLVRRFSSKEICKARYIRLAIELEIGRSAIARWTPAWAPKFEANLAAQNEAVAISDLDAFQASDEAFHRLIAEVAESIPAFDTVLENKAHIDRICTLSKNKNHEMKQVMEDHQRIYQALSTGDRHTFEDELRQHLSRLESTVTTVRKTHSDYFDD